MKLPLLLFFFYYIFIFINENLTLSSSSSLRAIILAWILIFTTAIPTAICHGEVHYVHKGVNHTACLFLDGYRHDLFQVWNQITNLTYATYYTPNPVGENQQRIKISFFIKKVIYKNQKLFIKLITNAIFKFY